MVKPRPIHTKIFGYTRASLIKREKLLFILTEHMYSKHLEENILFFL